MKNFISSKNFKILIPVLSILTMLSVLSYANINPFAILADAVSNAVYDFTASANRSTADEAESLSAENAELRAQLVDYLDLKRENERLKKYIEIKSDNPSYTLLFAKVIRRSSAGDCFSFTLGAGSSDGVSENDPIITENGLVGRVSTVTAESCTVDTILSPNIKAAAIDKNTLDSGIVCGSAQISGQNLTYLTQLSEDNGIKEGDIVTTSGEGGVYPENLIIGTVKSVEFNSATGERRAVIEPYEDIRNVSAAVVLIKD